MKRRRFFGMLAGLCAAPAVAMVPKATLLPRNIAEWGKRYLPLFPGDNLAAYQRAEMQAAVTNAMIASVVAVPLTHDEIVTLFERDTRLLGWPA